MEEGHLIFLEGLGRPPEASHDPDVFLSKGDGCLEMPPGPMILRGNPLVVPGWCWFKGGPWPSPGEAGSSCLQLLRLWVLSSSPRLLAKMSLWDSVSPSVKWEQGVVAGGWDALMRGLQNSAPGASPVSTWGCATPTL